MAAEKNQENIDHQVRRLAGNLRDQGQSPARDLWPDIDRAISAVENDRLRPAFRPGTAWLRMSVAAAAAMVLLVVGWWGSRHLSDELVEQQFQVAAHATEIGNPSSLEVIDQALGELNLALAQDPDNRSLTHLSLMLHQSRGRMVRRNMDIRLNGS